MIYIIVNLLLTIVTAIAAIVITALILDDQIPIITAVFLVFLACGVTARLEPFHGTVIIAAIAAMAGIVLLCLACKLGFERGITLYEWGYYVLFCAVNQIIAYIFPPMPLFVFSGWHFLRWIICIITMIISRKYIPDFLFFYGRSYLKQVKRTPAINNLKGGKDTFNFIL